MCSVMALAVGTYASLLVSTVFALVAGFMVHESVRCYSPYLVFHAAATALPSTLTDSTRRRSSL